MARKKLPIVIDNYVKSECWTQLLLSIIQTSEHAPAWISSHIGIIGLDNMSCWYGNLSKIFSYRDTLDILNFEEVNIWDVSPNRIIDFLHEEIDKENYIVLELKYNDATTGKGYWIHEQLIFGYNDDKKEFYGSTLNNKTGSFIEISITYDELILAYCDSYKHFKNPYNKDDFIFWSRSNFLVSRISLRSDYVPHGCEYDLIQSIVIEADGKEYTSVQYIKHISEDYRIAYDLVDKLNRCGVVVYDSDGYDYSYDWVYKECCRANRYSRPKRTVR